MSPLQLTSRPPAGQSAFPEWLRARKERALARYEALGMPTRRIEDWKYTNLEGLLAIAFEPAGGEGALPDLGELADAHRVVLVDGCFRPELSAPGPLPAGVYLGSLAAALADPVRLAALEPHLAGLASVQPETPSEIGKSAIAALNDALFEDGVVLLVPDGVALDRPVQVIVTTSDAARPVANHSRLLAVLGRQSEAALVVAHRSSSSEATLASWVAEFALGEGARLRALTVQEEGPHAYHFATMVGRVGRDARLATIELDLGGQLVRREVRATLEGTGAHAGLLGLYIANGRQHVDIATFIDHAVPGTTSEETYKGILDGHAHGVFSGKVLVRPDAQQTDAKQTSRNLLLSRDAVVDTKPQLEILADDVKCSHGATIGQLSEDALFYLRARGIGETEARAMLTLAFAEEVLGVLAEGALRERVGRAIATKLEEGR